MKIYKRDLHPTKIEINQIHKRLCFNIFIKHSPDKFECFNCGDFKDDSIWDCGCGDRGIEAGIFTKRKTIMKWDLVDVFRKTKEGVVRLTYYYSISQSFQKITRQFRLVRKIVINDTFECMVLSSLRISYSMGGFQCSFSCKDSIFCKIENSRALANKNFDEINSEILINNLPFINLFNKWTMKHHLISNSVLIYLYKYKKHLHKFFKKYKSYIPLLEVFPGNIRTIRTVLKVPTQIHKKAFIGVFNRARTWQDYLKYLTVKEKKDFNFVYQENWIKIHDERYRLAAELEEKKINLQIKEKNKTLRERYYIYPNDYINGVHIVKPEEYEDLKKEGESLRHCIANYFGDIIKSNNTLIFFVRSSYSESEVTCEVFNNKITQFRGKHNDVNINYDKVQREHMRQAMSIYLKKHNQYQLDINFGINLKEG